MRKMTPPFTSALVRSWYRVLSTRNTPSNPSVTFVLVPGPLTYRAPMPKYGVQRLGDEVIAGEEVQRIGGAVRPLKNVARERLIRSRRLDRVAAVLPLPFGADGQHGRNAIRPCALDGEAASAGPRVA